MFSTKKTLEECVVGDYRHLLTKEKGMYVYHRFTRGELVYLRRFSKKGDAKLHYEAVVDYRHKDT